MAVDYYEAYSIVPTNKTDEEGRPVSHWNRIGAAFTNRDGSINVRLTALPLNGVVHLREAKEQPERVSVLRPSKIAEEQAHA